MASRKRTRSPRSIELLASPHKNPAVRVKTGQRLDVVNVKMTTIGERRPATLGARLCGGTSTCLALMHVGKGDPVPRGG